MAVSEVEICNNALLEIGSRTITSLSDGTAEANACLQLYEITLNKLLREHFWNFALTRVALAADVTAPAFEYTVQYTLPADYVRTKKIWNSSATYKIEGGKLLTTQAAPLHLIYVRKVTDTTKFDPLFVDYFVYSLAIKLAKRLAGNDFNDSSLQRALFKLERDARTIDAQDDSPDQLILDSFNQYRYGLYNSGDPQWWMG